MKEPPLRVTTGVHTVGSCALISTVTLTCLPYEGHGVYCLDLKPWRGVVSAHQRGWHVQLQQKVGDLHNTCVEQLNDPVRAITVTIHRVTRGNTSPPWSPTVTPHINSLSYTRQYCLIHGSRKTSSLFLQFHRQSEDASRRSDVENRDANGQICHCSYFTETVDYLIIIFSEPPC